MAQATRKFWMSKLGRRVLGALCVFGIVCLALFYVFRPLSPQVITSRTIHALEVRDAETLVRLADPDEVKRLNLSPEVVSRFLSDTLWIEPSLTNAQLSPLQTQPDQSVWEVHWASEAHGTASLAVPVIDSQTIGWKLNLSYLLWGACWRHKHGADGMREYLTLALKYGITGLRQQSGNFVTLDTLEDTIVKSGH